MFRPARNWQRGLECQMSVQGRGSAEPNIIIIIFFFIIYEFISRTFQKDQVSRQTKHVQST